MMKKRMGREESQQVTRDKLFDTATDLMISKGFHAASVNAISEEAGFSKGAFFFKLCKQIGFASAIDSAVQAS